MGEFGCRDYWPEEWPEWPSNPKARKAAKGLYEIGLFILNAPASLRKSRLELTDNVANDCLSQMEQKEQERAKSLVALWEKNALIQQDIRYEEHAKGIDAIDHLLPEWHSAGAEMLRAEREALILGLAGHEYFRRRMEHFQIVQEEKDDFGRYHNYPDYSELREQWYSRKPITSPLPWAWDQMLILCRQFETKELETRKSLVSPKLGIVLTVAFGIASIVVTLTLWLI